VQWQRLALGPLKLKPDEFWRLQPREFIWMLEGVQQEREERRQEIRTTIVEVLHLQRLTANTLINIAQGLSGNKGQDLLDTHSIPEIDVHITRARKQHKEQQARKDEQALKKYKRIEQRLKHGV
jgi:hypothetical protein